MEGRMEGLWAIVLFSLCMLNWSWATHPPGSSSTHSSKAKPENGHWHEGGIDDDHQLSERDRETRSGTPRRRNPPRAAQPGDMNVDRLFGAIFGALDSDT